MPQSELGEAAARLAAILKDSLKDYPSPGNETVNDLIGTLIPELERGEGCSLPADRIERAVRSLLEHLVRISSASASAFAFDQTEHQGLNTTIKQIQTWLGAYVNQRILAETQAQLEEGMAIALAIVREIAAELALNLRSLTWKTEPEHHNEYSLSLLLHTPDGKQHVLTLPNALLEDAATDSEAKVALSGQIRRDLQALIPRRPRIGF